MNNKLNIFRNNKNKVLLMLLLVLIFLIVILFAKNATYSLDTLSEELSSEQQAIYDTAFAFYNRGYNVQYDTLSISFKTIYGKDFHIIPEDATRDFIRGTDCTTFDYSVFENAFEDKDGNPYKIGDLERGSSAAFVNLADPNSKTYNSDITKYFTDNPQEAKTKDFNFLDTDTNEEKAIKFIEKVGLEPGDIIAERDSSGNGHGIIYLGNDLIINSSQTVNYRNAPTYPYNDKHFNYNDYGTIGFVSFKDNVVSSTSGQINKYIFSSAIIKFAVISPLKEMAAKNQSENKGYRISQSASKRRNYTNLVINKVSSVKRTESVNLNQEITYEINLENRSNNKYNNILIEDKVPDNTKYVNCNNNCSYNSSTKTITWNNISLDSEKNKTYLYTVKVNNDRNLLGNYILNDNTKVNGLTINTIKTKVDNTLNIELQDEIKNIVTTKIKDDKTYNDNIANLIYSEMDESFNKFANINADSLLKKYSDIYKRCFYPNGENDEGNKCSELGNPNNLEKKEFEISVIEKNYSKFGVEKNNETNKYVSTLKDTYELKENEKEMLVDKLYGGVMMLNHETSFWTDRIARVTDNDFMIGDVLVIHDDDFAEEKTTGYDVSEKGMYLYIGDGRFATINDKGKIEIIDDKVVEKITIYYKSIKDETYANGRNVYEFDNGIQTKKLLSCKVFKLPGENGLSYFGKEGNQLTSNYRDKYDEECNQGQENNSCKVDTTSSSSTNYYYNNNGEKISYSIYKDECVPYYKTDRSRLIDSLQAQNAYIVLRPSYGFEEKVIEIQENGQSLKTEYIINKDNMGIKDKNITLIYNNGYEKTVKVKEIDGFDNTSLGQKNVIIKYEEDGVEKQQTYLITIVGDKVEKPTTDLCKSKEDSTYTGSSIDLTKITSTNGYTLTNYRQTIANESGYTITAKLASGYVWNDDSTKNVIFKCPLYKADPVITLDDDELETILNHDVSFREIANINGEFSVTSSDASKAIIFQDNTPDGQANADNLVTIQPKEVGEFTITVDFVPADTLNYNIVSKSINMKIIPKFYTINKYAYDEEKEYISKIDVNTTVNEYKNNIELQDGYTIEVDTMKINNNDVLYTGGKTKIYKNKILYIEFTNIVSGDTNGDGKINYLDYVAVYNHIKKTKNPNLDKKVLKNEFLIAADMSDDNKINYLDYVNIYNKIKSFKK